MLNYYTYWLLCCQFDNKLYITVDNEVIFRNYLYIAVFDYLDFFKCNKNRTYYFTRKMMVTYHKNYFAKCLYSIWVPFLKRLYFHAYFSKFKQNPTAISFVT